MLNHAAHCSVREKLDVQHWSMYSYYTNLPLGGAKHVVPLGNKPRIICSLLPR